MKTHIVVIYINLVCLSVLFKNTEAINCVQCSGCADPYSNTTNPSTACSQGLDACIKTAIKYPGGSMIQKGCVSSIVCSSSTSVNVNLGTYGFWLSCCNTDACNSTTANKSNLNGILSFLLFYCFKYFLF